MAAFEGCSLKHGARGPVIYDGILGADVLVLGEAPGAEEDRIGKPYVGRSGQLLDRMLAAIDLSRAPKEGQGAVCLSNAVYWRPPSNRNPSKAEVATCLPFMKRFIELSRPKLVLLTGNVPNQALFPDAPGITRDRGKVKVHETSDGQKITALPLFHPAFLLRQPIQKRWAWRDLLTAKATLNETLS
ncbi:uracil-DNA glycosylase [Parvularcula sp. BGMRC 0090]|uniref:Type-4 uracil-DNA glycosylase n=1 Tax=Parvularcula maris TaxID=2965077 RepID=A0A9X2RJG0_9PROT|nr:uracil-DNA glycosylase [Parvularcula maris]